MQLQEIFKFTSHPVVNSVCDSVKMKACCLSEDFVKQEIMKVEPEIIQDLIKHMLAPRKFLDQLEDHRVFTICKDIVWNNLEN